MSHYMYKYINSLLFYRQPNAGFSSGMEAAHRAIPGCSVRVS
jgi:hypothetical protein